MKMNTRFYDKQKIIAAPSSFQYINRGFHKLSEIKNASIANFVLAVPLKIDYIGDVWNNEA